MAILGAVAGLASMAMSKAAAVRPAVAHGVWSPPLVGVIAATSPPTAAPGLGRGLVMDGLDLVGEGGVGGGKRGFRGNKLQ